MPNSEILLKETNLSSKADLVLYFGERGYMEDGSIYHTLKEAYPQATLLGCSTGGEIQSSDFYDGSVVALAIDFEKTQIQSVKQTVQNSESSFDAGVSLAKALYSPQLRGIFVISDGLYVDGSQLAKGIASVVSDTVPITGGLAGDGAQFQKTLVGLDEVPTSGQVAAIGFYGDSIRFGYGSVGGWDIFGPKRLITKSKGNILYELDGKPALDLYKTYLGPMAEKLPASALTFPINIHPVADPTSAVVRTILAVDEDQKSMTFAGTIPEGYMAQFLRGTLKHLVKGAEEAASSAMSIFKDPCQGDSAAIMISCVGRKLLLGQKIIDEIEAASDVFQGKMKAQIGFYSYGEISPHANTGQSELHNQTMTITTLAEV